MGVLIASVLQMSRKGQARDLEGRDDQTKKFAAAPPPPALRVIYVGALKST